MEDKTMDYILETNALCKSYGKARILKDVAVHIPKGSIYGLIGKNGAGKTTLMRILTGLQRPSSGTYAISGVSDTDADISKVRRRIGSLVESPALYKDMSAYENMKIQSLNLGLPSYDHIDELLKITGLADTGRKPAGKFSLGMRGRLGIALAMCGDPDILILDEPVNGLDPQGMIEIREMILELNKKKGTTILISSHLLDELSRVATHYGFIDRGRIIREISKEDLEKSLNKTTTLKVTDVPGTLKVLDRESVKYEVISDDGIMLFDCMMNPSEIISSLSSEGITVTGFNQNEESLESYFMNLLSEGDN